jgi:hypothetical protein
MRLRVAVLSTVLGLGASLPSDQTARTDTQNPPTGSIAGQVVDALTTKPVGGAIVTIGGTALGPARTRAGLALPFLPASLEVTADTQGRFVFDRLPPGSYGVGARAPEYLPGGFGALGPVAGSLVGASLMIDLPAGERLSSKNVRLWKAASITGTMTDELGRPVRKATLQALRWTVAAGRKRLAPNGPSATTDDRGGYRIGGLLPGEYVVFAPSVQITLPATGTREAAIQMSRGSASAYPSTDLPERTVGEWLLRSFGTPLAASPDGSVVLVYPAVFYPSARTPSNSATFSLKAGDEQAGVDIGIAPERGFRVAGRLVSTVKDLSGLLVRLVPAGPSADLAQALRLDTAAALSDATGRFTFVGVVPGDYSIKVFQQPRPVSPANAGTMVSYMSDGVAWMAVSDRSAGDKFVPFVLPTTPTLWANGSVSVVDRDVSDIGVPLQEGVHIAGRIEFEGPAARPDADRLALVGIAAVPAKESQLQTAGSAGYVRVEPDGTFSSVGIAPDSYLIRVGNLPPDWGLKSARVNGVDASLDPVDITQDIKDITITLTDRFSELSGFVRLPGGESDQVTAVIVFPTNRRRWIDNGLSPRDLQITRVRETGAYSFRGLPAGEYYVVAAPAPNLDTWRDPAHLAALVSRASKVSIAEGAKVFQSLDAPRR